MIVHIKIIYYPLNHSFIASICFEDLLGVVLLELWQGGGSGCLCPFTGLLFLVEDLDFYLGLSQSHPLPGGSLEPPSDHRNGDVI